MPKVMVCGICLWFHIFVISGIVYVGHPYTKRAFLNPFIDHHTKLCFLEINFFRVLNLLLTEKLYC